MILTEEQLEAIRAVSDLPRVIGCTQCHSYIQEHYGNQFAILRAMIDSSDQFGDRIKLTPGFDLEVRWHDDYMKRFSDITAWHCGHATLWIMHSSGKQEWIPLASVRRISSVEKSP